jgi:hypothetical protein
MEQQFNLDYNQAHEALTQGKTIGAAVDFAPLKILGMDIVLYKLDGDTLKKAIANSEKRTYSTIREDGVWDDAEDSIKELRAGKYQVIDTPYERVTLKDCATDLGRDRILKSLTSFIGQ